MTSTHRRTSTWVCMHSRAQVGCGADAGAERSWGGGSAHVKAVSHLQRGPLHREVLQLREQAPLVAHAGLHACERVTPAAASMQRRPRCPCLEQKLGSCRAPRRRGMSRGRSSRCPSLWWSTICAAFAYMHVHGAVAEDSRACGRWHEACITCPSTTSYTSLQLPSTRWRTWLSCRAKVISQEPPSVQWPMQRLRSCCSAGGC